MIGAVPFDPAGAAEWDELAARSPMATLLHSRRFLSYHGDRFEDASLVFRDGEKMVGALPAARDPGDRVRVISHPGATFGGVLHDGALGGERMHEALTAAAAVYRDLGLDVLLYKAVPWIYHQLPSEDDLHALFRLGADRTRVDLACAIDLSERRMPSTRRRRGLKKAQNAGLELSRSRELLPAYWELLEGSLSQRYGVEPVHSLEEISRLAELFENEIEFVFAVKGDEVVAGTVLFLSKRVAHMQYSASGEQGRSVNALDAVFEHAIAAADAAGRRFFDFGISTEDEGRRLNEDLYRFKFEFGGGGVTYEFYELGL
jgi:Acetyltransferase (GNAT) domain